MPMDGLHRTRWKNCSTRWPKASRTAVLLRNFNNDFDPTLLEAAASMGRLNRYRRILPEVRQAAGREVR